MSVLDKITVDLGPTATYSLREAEWVPGDEPGSGSGWLTIWLRKSLRAGSKVEQDTYQCEELAAPEPGVRSWLLLNVYDRDQPDVYACTLGPRGDLCTCTAGNCRVPSGCKHRSALRTLMEQGFSDEPDMVPTGSGVWSEDVLGEPTAAELAAMIEDRR